MRTIFAEYNPVFILLLIPMRSINPISTFGTIGICAQNRSIRHRRIVAIDIDYRILNANRKVLKIAVRYVCKIFLSMI